MVAQREGKAERSRGTLRGTLIGYARPYITKVYITPKGAVSLTLRLVGCKVQSFGGQQGLLEVPHEASQSQRCG